MRLIANVRCSFEIEHCRPRGIIQFAQSAQESSDLHASKCARVSRTMATSWGPLEPRESILCAGYPIDHEAFRSNDHSVGRFSSAVIVGREGGREGGRQGGREDAGGRVLEPNSRAIEMANIFGFYRASPVLSIIRIVARSHRWVFDFQTSAPSRRAS
jgi:hypothetical protein